MNEEILRLIHPNIREYVREVLVHGKVGIGAGNLRITEVKSGRPTNETSENGDRFKLLIPYAGQIISWDIVFNTYRTNFPPDFNFNDETFFSDPDIEIIEKDVPSLAMWDGKDSKCLLHVITELLYLYRKHQLLLLIDQDYTRIQFGYSSYDMSFSEEDVEVLVGSRGSKSRLMEGEVNLLIRLKVDFSGLPPILSTDNTGENAAMLLVTFHPPDGIPITPQLHLSPGVEKVLGGAGMLSLPPFPPGCHCLVHYLPIVQEQLQERVANIASCYDKKKEYLAALFFHLGESVLEYDGVSFSHASFMLEHNYFYFILHIKIPQYFPRDRPILVFQSVYYATYGNPYQSSHEDYPYSPHWDANEMVKRVYNYILEYVEVFKKNSIQRF